MGFTNSQKKVINLINESSKWCVMKVDETLSPFGEVYVYYRNYEDCVYLKESGTMAIGKRGGVRIINHNSFSFGDKNTDEVSASLFCFDVFEYGKHPRIELV